MELNIRSYHCALCILCAVLLVSIYSLVNADIEFDICLSTQYRFRVLYGSDVNKCKEECGRRIACQRINYRVARKECGLYNKTFISQDYTNLSCVLVNREDIDQPKCNCTKGKVCQSDGSCKYEECPPIPQMDPNRGVVMGNMQHIGAKVRVQCEEGFVRFPDNEFVLCGDDGQWMNFPECLWECGKPCERFPYTNNVSSGGIIEGDERNYTCFDDFYVSNNQTTTYFTAVCTLKKWFYPELLCMNDSVRPRHPESVHYVGCFVYEINEIKVTQNDAYDFCKPYGRLARIDTMKSQTRIQRFLNWTQAVTSSEYWIQGKLDSNKWKFADGGEIENIKQFWGKNQPNRKNQSNHCVTIRRKFHFLWDDRGCPRTFGYICEYL